MRLFSSKLTRPPGAWSWETSSEEFLSRRMHGCLFYSSWGFYYLFGGVSDSGHPVRVFEAAFDDLSFVFSESSYSLPDEAVS